MDGITVDNLSNYLRTKENLGPYRQRIPTGSELTHHGAHESLTVK